MPGAGNSKKAFLFFPSFAANLEATSRARFLKEGKECFAAEI
jgi:hypothetical protein